MSLYEKMTELADAVRDLTGGTAPLTLDDMVRSIRSVSTSDIINTAEGNPIQIADCMTRKLHGLTIYGKTLQKGTPSPSAPVALDSVGNDGNIIINVDEQTLTVSTPNGLPGIPVTSDGNYTDESGQMWICDEIDFARGRYVQRIGRIKFSNLVWSLQADRNRFVSGDVPNILYKDNALRWETVLSNKFSVDTSGLDGTIYQNGYAVVVYCNSCGSVEDFAAMQFNTDVQYILKTPVETSLTAEELVAYSKLHTNYPQTTIYNDEGAWMTVNYAADTKTYIDNQVAEAVSVMYDETEAAYEEGVNSV